jgi:hypothetical protein
MFAFSLFHSSFPPLALQLLKQKEPQMNSQLTLFTDPAVLSRVNRPILTLVLQHYQASLPPDAVALLTTSLNSLSFEEYCAAWASQFKSADNFGAPLLDALHAIEFLAQTENAATLDDALSHLPPGYEINRNFPPLHQALHLWLLTLHTPGVIWPPAPRSHAHDAPGAPHAPTPLSPLPSSRCTQNGVPAAPAPISAPSAVPLSTPNSQLSTAASSFSILPSISSPDSETEANAEADAAADAVILRKLKPWPEPITDAPALFDQVHDRAIHYLYLPPGAAVVLTLWPGHTHAVKAFTHSPRLYVTSTEPGCGKTTALDFIACLCPNVLRTDNIKPAVIYRVSNKHDPTLVLDEFDAYSHQYPDLRGIIDAGHNQHGCVLRCAGPNVRSFKAYAATAIAGIGDLAPTLAHRSIIIRLTKAPPGALRARFDRRHTKFETTLGRKIARWVQDNYAAIAACEPVMPPDVINRLADNWRPLFAVAQVIGGHWPQRLLEAFDQLTAAPQACPATPVIAHNGQCIPPATVHLLSDIHRVFIESSATSLFSIDIVRGLAVLPLRNGQRPLTEAALARQLLPLGLRPRQIRINSIQARGYDLADFAPLFASLSLSDSCLNGWSPDI